MVLQHDNDKYSTNNGKHNFCHTNLIYVSYIFSHAGFKYVIRIAPSPTVFVWQNFLKWKFGEISFCHATIMI